MLLESRNALDRWQNYEQTAVRRALSEWCEQHRLLLTEE
jgi:hypothetical protein